MVGTISSSLLVIFCGICPGLASDLTEYQFFLTFSTISAGNINYGTASSQFKTTFLVDSGLTSTNAAWLNNGATAAWTSEVSLNSDGTFNEKGNISFTTSSILYFESAAPGISHDRPGDGNGYGTINYEVTGGEGAFAGAQGWMADMFISTGISPSFDINAVLVLWVPNDEETRLQQVQSSQNAAINPVASISPGSQTPKATETANERYDFSWIFEAHEVDGYNHGSATTQELSTIINLDDTAPFTFTLLNETTGPTVEWLSHSTSYDNGTFSNTGNITLFGSSGESIAMLLFENDGLGHFKDGPDTDGSSYGGIGYKIIQGTGLWEGAFGGFVDMFVGTGDNVYFPIYVLGTFWIPN